jgi:putative PIN family toxin of toxin-antitoxin system
LKAVFDSNIFVSALAIPGGQAERAIELVIDARVNLCISKEIIHEVLGVLAHKFAKDPEELSRTALFLSDLAEIVVPRKKLKVFDDEPDNRILECAVTGRAEVIVTGDQAMLKLRQYRGIRLLALRQFLSEVAGDWFKEAADERSKLDQQPNNASHAQVAFGFAVTPELLKLGITWALALGLVGGLLPALRAARLPITTALRGEW